MRVWCSVWLLSMLRRSLQVLCNRLSVVVQCLVSLVLVWFLVVRWSMNVTRLLTMCIWRLCIALVEVLILSMSLRCL